MPSFRAIASAFRHETDKVKGSRFLGIGVPISAEPDVEDAVRACRAEFHDARHHCWAWRLGRDGDAFRYSDDGEPSGSAGRPILQAIDGRDLTNTLVIVVRWFGGTKLGVGGLVRAYGGCAGELLDGAEISTVRIIERWELAYSYELSRAVDALLAGETEITVSQSDYGAAVRLVLEVPEELVAGFRDRVRDATADRAQLRPL